MKKQISLVALILITGQIMNGQKISFPEMGQIKPRSSHEIAASPWSIGGETMDRDYTIFDNWKEHLAPLGAKKIRLQAGWAKCEPEKGVYNFQWLDEIIDGVLESGVEPWLQCSYGNPIHGGEAKLGGGMPVTPEALDAWDRWVSAMATRYSGRVKIWEVWNEPDLHPEKVTAEQYAVLYIRTAEIIKKEIPDATLYAGSLAFPGKTEFTERFLSYLKERDKLHLVDEITFHGYYFLPAQAYWAPYRLNEKEDVFSPLLLHQVVQKYSDKIKIRQGEQGAPSEPGSGALGEWEWTELKQAKWLPRRLLTDWGHGIPASYFGIMDMNYAYGKGDKFNKMNTKGLIKANEDRTVDYLKPSYYAFQHLSSIFDYTLEPTITYPYQCNNKRELSLYGFEHIISGFQAVAFWYSDEWPTDNLETDEINFTFPNGSFTDPVLVDIRTGKIYDIPDNQWSKNGTEYSFKKIPVYDSPLLIIEKSLLRINNINE